MIVRPRASSLQRTVRFNALLLDGNNSDSTDESSDRDDGPTQGVNGSRQSKKVSAALADGNNNYVEFRRILKNTPSKRKQSGSNGSCNGGGSTSVAESSKSRTLSATDLKVITDTATEAAPPSPQAAQTEPAGERDDEPTPRHDDDQSVGARSQGTITSSAAQSTHTAFSIPDGDRQDMKVVVNAASVLEVRTAPEMPQPLHSTDVVVAVEASSVSALDCVMRRCMHGEVSKGFVPGCSFVGTVVRCGEEAFLSGISEGERVASIVRGGANSRFVVANANALVKMPDDVDPSEAAGVLLEYLMAFQALHSDMTAPLRYKAALEGKRILVTENTGLVGMAIASLAKLSGAKKTFIVCPVQHHGRVKSLGAVPLDEDSKMWPKVLKKKVDVMIETSNIQTTAHLTNMQRYLKASGRLVRLGTPSVAAALPQSKPFQLPVRLENFCTQLYLSFLARASFYEVFYSVEKNQAMFKSDLSHIVNLLSQRKIRPKIEKFILLQDVAECHQEVEKFQLDGAIVCEPWRRGGFDSMIYNT